MSHKSLGAMTAPDGALSMMILEDGPLFIADTHVHSEPTPQQLAEIVIGAARHVRRFGLDPKSPCVRNRSSAISQRHGRTLRAAIEILDARGVDFAYEGEMNIDAALDPELRDRICPKAAWRAPPMCWSLPMQMPHRACATS